jgi:hypothetical protein
MLELFKIIDLKERKRLKSSGTETERERDKHG